MSTDVIFGLGNDALQNMFDVTFPDGLPTGGNTDNISLRCDMSFQVPEQSVGTYEVHKKGIKLTKTNTVTETTKEFTTEYRVDQNWETVQDVINYCKAVYDPMTGTALPETMTRCTVLCQAVDTQNAVKKIFRFKNAKPKAWSLNPFDNTGTDAMRLTIHWIYVDLIIENA